MSRGYNLAENYLEEGKIEVKKIRDGLGQGMAELGEQKTIYQAQR